MAKAKQLPSGNWRVQAAITVDGKTIKKSFTAETARKAEALAMQWQELTREENEVENITLRKAYERYIESKSNVIAVSTLREYRRHARADLQDIMDIKINALTENRIQISINNYSANHSPKTVANVYSLLSSVLKMFRSNFYYNVKLPQKKPVEMYIPTDDDIKDLLTNIKGTRLEVPVMIAAFGGLRRGEICALKASDVIGNTIRINKALTRGDDGVVLKDPKNFTSFRVVELPNFVIDKINQAISKRGENFIGYQPNSLTKAFETALSKINVPHFRLHDLRHYNVSILHAMGVPDKYIMARGGWATNSTMNKVYKHALSDKQREFNTMISNNFETYFNASNDK